MNTAGGYVNKLHSKPPRSILRAVSSMASTECVRPRKKSATRLAPDCKCLVGSCMCQRPEMRNSVCKPPAKERRKHGQELENQGSGARTEQVRHQYIEFGTGPPAMATKRAREGTPSGKVMGKPSSPCSSSATSALSLK